MSAFLGLDIGTSGVKAVLVDERDVLLAEAAAPLTISCPRPNWAEQDPASWWEAVAATLDDLAATRPRRLGDVASIGLSGQMLGVTLLDATDRVLRPALLWNDGRAVAECRELERRVPDFCTLTGSRPMSGFPAPKLLWLAGQEPDTMARTRRVLLPKDVIRLRLTGEAASDRADSSATLLMDTRAGTWSGAILDAVGIRPDSLPRLVGSAEIAGTIRPEWALRWGLAAGTPVVGGAGDNMCGAIGAGIAAPGQGYVGLGTSGVFFLTNDRFLPARGAGMHTHRHAVGDLFAQHGCVLSAGAALAWVTALVGATDAAALMREVEAAALPVSATPVFTPYLLGERTPHDDPDLSACLSGLRLGSTRLHLVQAVMEGVALALGDCHRALLATGAPVRAVSLVGGGARSLLWSRLIASELDTPLKRPRSGHLGPALGAARLARTALGGELFGGAGECEIVQPSQGMTDGLRRKREAFAAQARLSRRDHEP